MPIAVILGILAVYNVWKKLDVDLTKHLIIALFASGLIFYTTMAFCVAISSKVLNPLAE